MGVHKKLEAVKKQLSRVQVVLVRPKYGENVGAAARVAHNMGISRLVVVADEMPEQAAMEKMATHHAKGLITDLRLAPTLDRAVANCSWVVGTTARQGRRRFFLENPAQMVEHLLPKLAHNRVALVFGPENQGLSNAELELCNATVTIPTADFSSLNLGQAVGVICYELFSTLMNRKGGSSVAPSQASSRVLAAMYDNLEETLRAIGYLREADLGQWRHNFSHFFNRIGLRAREVKLINGICKQVQWLADGKAVDKGEGKKK
ncbi:MAG: RNA methyltransferase [Thermodesulfobacteriota bacterium]